MKAKWYFSTLLIIFALLGVFQEEVSVPNQEIVLQFSDAEVSSNKAQNTLAIVVQQLQTVGISDIQVREHKNGQLRITYYSDTDVASIKRTLSQENKLEIGFASFNEDENHSKFPFKNKSNDYNLDVFEILNKADAESDVNGKFVLELKQEYDRFSNPNVYPYVIEIDDEEKDRIVKVAYKANRNVASAIDNTSYKIPEVRAGPSNKGDS